MFRHFIYVSLTLAGTIAMAAQSRTAMYDPLFYITYDPHRIHFELAPPVIGQLCGADLRTRKLWVYAKWITKDADYYIVSGFIVNHPDGPGKGDISPDPDGIAVAIRGTKCVAEDALWVMSGEAESDQKAALPETFPEALPGDGAPAVCERGGNKCHYLIRSREARAILDGLASDALGRFSRAFGGKTEFLNAYDRSTHNPDFIVPVIRSHIEEYRKSN